MNQNDNILQSIEYLCFDVYLTKDNRVLDMDLREIKPRLNNCSYVFLVDGKLKTRKFIKENGVEIKDYIGDEFNILPYI